MGYVEELAFLLKLLFNEMNKQSADSRVCSVSQKGNKNDGWTNGPCSNSKYFLYQGLYQIIYSTQDRTSS